MLDAGEGVTDQDATVLGARARRRPRAGGRGQQVGRAERLPAPAGRVAADAQARLRRLGRSGAHFSAKHGSGLRELFKAIHRAHASATQRVQHQPKSPRRWKSPTKPIRRRSCAATSPSCASPIPAAPIRRRSSSTAPACARCRDTYRRYLENFFRKRFKLVGTPVRFVFKEGENPYEGQEERADRQAGRQEAAPDPARQARQVTPPAAALRPE